MTRQRSLRVWKRAISDNCFAPCRAKLKSLRVELCIENHFVVLRVPNGPRILSLSLSNHKQNWISLTSLLSVVSLTSYLPYVFALLKNLTEVIAVSIHRVRWSLRLILFLIKTIEFQLLSFPVQNLSFLRMEVFHYRLFLMNSFAGLLEWCFCSLTMRFFLFMHIYDRC